MAGTLALASSIAAMDQQALAELVASRRVISPASVHEPLGLAVELLRADSISRALQSAHREALEALRALSIGEAADPAILASLISLGLVGTDAEGRPTALPEVTEALPGEAFEANPARTARTDSAPDDLTGWFAAALTSVRRTAKLLHTIAAHPVRLGRKGKPAVVAVRELAEAAHCSPVQASRLLEVMRGAELLRAHFDHAGAEQLGIAEPATQRWLMQHSYAERWIELARAAGARFDARLLRGLAETGGNLRAVAEALPHDYPLLPEAELESLIAVTDAAEDLGLTLHGHLTPVAEALLRGDEGVVVAIAERDIPGNVPGVYLQPDLSIIVPGPLPPEDEAVLNAISETEQLGPAASLRVSTEKLTRAVQRAGSGTGEVRAALERLSLTGIPQPLDYLLRDLDRKANGYGAGFEGTASAIELHGWDAEAHEARLKQRREAALQAAPITLMQAPSHEDELRAMIERVVSAVSDEGGEGDLTRRLELAIRDRSPVRVTAVAGKDEREFTLLPVSLKGGRLRATDQQAGVERTLPVSAITAVASIAA